MYPSPNDPSPEFEPIPEAIPVEAELVPSPDVHVELVQPADPVVEVQRLREQHRRWKGRFIAVCIVVVFLLIVSVLQFIGTFITCQMLFAARRDSENAQQRTTELLNQFADARNSLNQATKNLFDAQRSINQLRQTDAKSERRAIQAELQQAALLQQAHAINQQIERRIREFEEMLGHQLREGAAQVEQMRGLLEQDQAKPLPFVDPFHKHRVACPVDHWPGVRGVSSMREPTATQIEEDAHDLTARAMKPDADGAELLPPPRLEQAPARVETLRELVRSKLVPSRLSAVSSLAEIGPAASAATPDLIRLLEEDHSGLVREAAAECLGKLKARAAIPALIDAMERDDYTKARAEAAIALSRIGREAVAAGLPALKAKLKSEKNESVRGHLEAAIERLETVEATVERPVDRAVTFGKHVLPILTARCGQCHDATNFKSGLDVTQLATLKRGGRSGFPAVVPGDLKKSLLWEYIELKQMPPEGVPPLTATETDIIKRWIAGKE
jgi:hypothetical protein